MKVLGFDHPTDLWFCLEHDLWCRRLDDGSVQVGITAFGVHLSGDFYMARPKPVGTVLAQGQTLAVVELSKSIVAIKTPLAGTVRAINPLLEATPERIHQDPYGQGWLAILQPSDWTADSARLQHGSGLPEAARQRMRREPMSFEEDGPT